MYFFLLILALSSNVFYSKPFNGLIDECLELKMQRLGDKIMQYNNVHYYYPKSLRQVKFRMIYNAYPLNPFVPIKYSNDSDKFWDSYVSYFGFDLRVCKFNSIFYYDPNCRCIEEADGHL